MWITGHLPHILSPNRTVLPSDRRANANKPSYRDPRVWILVPLFTISGSLKAQELMNIFHISFLLVSGKSLASSALESDSLPHWMPEWMDGVFHHEGSSFWFCLILKYLRHGKAPLLIKNINYNCTCERPPADEGMALVTNSISNYEWTLCGLHCN